MEATVMPLIKYRQIVLDQQAESMLSIFECAGFGPACEAVYVSTPITTGEAFVEWFEYGRPGRTIDPSTHAALIKTNTSSAEALVRRVRSLCSDRLVADPTRLSDVPGWNQFQYRMFWCAFVERFARTVVFNDGWQFSNGCSAEYATAVNSGAEILDGRLNSIPVSTGLMLLDEGIKRFELASLDATQLMEAKNAVRAFDQQH